MTRPTWSDHEQWLADFLEPLVDDVHPAPLMACFSGEDADWLVGCRRERRDDRADPLTELAVVVAELTPDAAVLAAPSSVRDLARPGAPVASRAWTLTSIARRPGSGGYELRVRLLPVGGVGSASDLDIELSPVASVLDDAVRHRLGEDPVHVWFTAGSWGHTLYAGGVGDLDLERGPGERDRFPDTARVRDAEAARHRLGRHTGDLAARHRPTTGWPQVLHRPAVHACTPEGWQAACPV